MVDKSSDENLDTLWSTNRKRVMGMLQREAELEELVRLVGIDALPYNDRLLLQGARIIREDFLHQNAFDERDTYTSLKKQFMLLKVILHYYDEAKAALTAGATLDSLAGLKVLDDIARAKLIPEDDLGQFVVLEERIAETIRELTRQ
jgi:V/A-type H+-transporting ATPase subunit A